MRNWWALGAVALLALSGVVGAAPAAADPFWEDITLAAQGHAQLRAGGKDACPQWRTPPPDQRGGSVMITGCVRLPVIFAGSGTVSVILPRMVSGLPGFRVHDR